MWYDIFIWNVWYLILKWLYSVLSTIITHSKPGNADYIVNGRGDYSSNYSKIFQIIPVILLHNSYGVLFTANCNSKTVVCLCASMYLVFTFYCISFFQYLSYFFVVILYIQWYNLLKKFCLFKSFLMKSVATS